MQHGWIYCAEWQENFWNNRHFLCDIPQKLFNFETPASTLGHTFNSCSYFDLFLSFISFRVKLQLLTSATLVSCCPAIWETMCIKLYRDATSRQNRYSLIEFLNGTLNFTPLRLQSIVSSVNPKWVGSFRSPAPCYRWRCNFPSDSRFPDGVKWPNAEIRDAW